MLLNIWIHIHDGMCLYSYFGQDGTSVKQRMDKWTELRGGLRKKWGKNQMKSTVAITAANLFSLRLLAGYQVNWLLDLVNLIGNLITANLTGSDWLI